MSQCSLLLCRWQAAAKTRIKPPAKGPLHNRDKLLLTSSIRMAAAYVSILLLGLVPSPDISRLQIKDRASCLKTGCGPSFESKLWDEPPYTTSCRVTILLLSMLVRRSDGEFGAVGWHVPIDLRKVKNAHYDFEATTTI